jgi:hypothetical protein
MDKKEYYKHCRYLNKMPEWLFYAEKEITITDGR